MLMVSALVTLLFEFCFGHGIEFVKIVRQTSPDSYYNIVKKITAEKVSKAQILQPLFHSFKPSPLFRTLAYPHRYRYR